jgi:predicted phage tail protein
MTTIKLHGLLAKEYGETFKMRISNPKHVLQAIDCNRAGFIKRVVDLHKEGLGYEIIINKTRLSEPSEMENLNSPKTIDIVPVIVGSSGIEFVAILKKVLFAVIFATISYALTPKPDVDSLEIEADANKSSLVFSNRVNVASQGAPVPVGYGRLKVGTQVIQATVKSYPQYNDPNYLLTDGQDISDVAIQTNITEDPSLFFDPSRNDNAT